MKRLLTVSCAALLALGAVLAVNTVRLTPAPKAPPAEVLLAVDADAMAARLAGALRIPTVTHVDRSRVDWTQWARLHAYLRAAFPRVHAGLEREVVADHSLLYTWPGADPARAPILLLGHTDVVPVPDDTLAEWTHAPFDGVVRDGYVWGRGAIDDKSGVLSQLEAVEALLARGFRPQRTVYLAFGHDEEVLGGGAVALAALLASRGVRAEWALDEGGAVLHGIFPGIEAPVALIPTSEKGYLSLVLTADGEPGHSSMPPERTAVGRVARAVARLQEAPFPLTLTRPVATMLERLAPHMDLKSRVAIANRWLLEGAVLRSLAAAGGLAGAMVRTTTAPTVFHAGDKDNILPRKASAVVNFRILPGQTRDTVEARVRGLIDDPGISIGRLPSGSDPSGAPDGDGAPGFSLLERTVNEVFPDAVVAPGLVVGGTDLRQYDAVARHRYNFGPLRFQPPDMKRFHGNDERIGVADYARMVQFHARLLQHAAGQQDANREPGS